MSIAVASIPLFDTYFCSAPGMPLKVMSSLPLLLLFSVKRGHQAAMLGKLISYCTALN